jgi:TPR repeat protein
MASSELFYRMGLSYSIGQGVPQDLIQAHKWLNLAAEQGDPRARRVRSEIARDMSSAEIAEAQRQAREWRRVN